jgi:restriction system protein
MRDAFVKAFPACKSGAVANSVAMLHKFSHRMQPGDVVVTYDPESRKYWVGEVASDYFYKVGLVRTTRMFGK